MSLSSSVQDTFVLKLESSRKSY